MDAKQSNELAIQAIERVIESNKDTHIATPRNLALWSLAALYEAGLDVRYTNKEANDDANR